MDYDNLNLGGKMSKEKLVTIKLTQEQIEQLQPLADEHLANYAKPGERQMFAGQVINSRDIKEVVFGFIPTAQAEVISRIRGLSQ